MAAGKPGVETRHREGRERRPQQEQKRALVVEPVAVNLDRVAQRLREMVVVKVDEREEQSDSF
jgi:hypothetical protein